MTSDQTEDGVLATIDSNGCYLLPPGFAYENLDTLLHRSVKSLIDRDAIRPDGRDWLGFEKWVRK